MSGEAMAVCSTARRARRLWEGFSLVLLPTGMCDKNKIVSLIQQKLRARASSVFEGTPVLFAYLYGSYVKELSHPFSDLDVGIFVEGIDVEACRKLELSLSLCSDEKLDHAVQSEVRVLNHLPLVVKGRILGEAELIYSRAEDNRIEFETKIRKAYFDFLPTIRQYQKAYRERALGV